MYSKYYSRFLNENKGKQHFACHSHYYWPDVTRDAMIQYWDDSAKYVDAKWDYIFGEKLPAVQRLIADNLNLSHPSQIVFAPNTHEFVFRILSCFPLYGPLCVVSSDSEFYSFHRQIDRLAESGEIKVIKVPQFPVESFETRMQAAIEEHRPGLVFFSQVFFNSGIAVKDLKSIVRAAGEVGAMAVIDAYHGFMTVPTDLKDIENDAFYIAGSYKYAQGGEGCCFMHVPVGSTARPLYTGWFAEPGALTAARSDKVTYAGDGMRFSGATFDCTALYRLQAVLQMFKTDGLTVEVISSYIKDRQAKFLRELDRVQHPLINRSRLLSNDLNHHGGFLTFRLDSPDQVAIVAAKLKELGILTDYRGDRLRFGFALYHEGEYDLSALGQI